MMAPPPRRISPSHPSFHHRIKARYALATLAVLVLDQWSKWFVEVRIPDGSAQPLIPGFLNLVHVRNSGVAFGLFSSPDGVTSWRLIALGLAVLTIVGLYFWRTPHHERLLLSALALVAGGAIGNLLDRVMSGAVTDFIDVYLGSHHWPSFNVADSAITVGIALMLLEIVLPLGYRGDQPTTAEGPPPQPAPTAAPAARHPAREPS